MAVQQTDTDLNQLDPGEFIETRPGIFSVPCFKIDDRHMHIICPFCRNKYRKNGLPRKTSKPVIHTHGVLSPWTVDRHQGFKMPHCDPKGFKLSGKESYKFEFWVTDKTIKIVST